MATTTTILSPDEIKKQNPDLYNKIGEWNLDSQVTNYITNHPDTNINQLENFVNEAIEGNTKPKNNNTDNTDAKIDKTEAAIGTLKSIISNQGVANGSTLDFFKLYNLKKYSTDTADTDLLGAFMPIYLKTALMKDDDYTTTNYTNESQIDTLEDITIILPWEAKDLQDSVSVSFSKKYNEGILGNAVQIAVSELGQHFGGIGKATADLFSINYNANDLKKELSLSFILPLTHVTKLDAKFVQTCRIWLGTLQAVCYPRGIAAFLPPLMKVRLGYMYRGFKGFISNVTINQSEHYITDNNVTWPLVISGEIKFTNFFNYYWAGGDESFLHSGLFGQNQFNLKLNPSLLFGINDVVSNESGETISASDTSSTGTTTSTTNTNTEGSDTKKTTENPTSKEASNAKTDKTTVKKDTATTANSAYKADSKAVAPGL